MHDETIKEGDMIRIAGIISKWKSRVARFGDMWFIHRVDGQFLLISEKGNPIDARTDRIVLAWVENGCEIEVKEIINSNKNKT